MDSLIAWLSTPLGIEAAHAVIALVTAIAALLAAWSARISSGNRKLLNGHLQEHKKVDKL